jgi:aminoglycoside 3-N-acetyltransferase
MSKSKGLTGSRAVVTGSDLDAVFVRLGVRKGSVLLVHACWVDPALPASMWKEVREEMPPFDPRRTPPSLMGQLALSVTLDPESCRSDHPLASFAALGPQASALTAEHDLRDPFGPRSPLARAVELDADVLLVGVDQTRNSLIYHAQCLADLPQIRGDHAPFLASIDGERCWVSAERLPECSEGFSAIEDELVSRGLVRCARAGDGTCRLMKSRRLVSFLEDHFRLWPRAVCCERADCRQCARPAG